jgi:hypothetical protein
MALVASACGNDARPLSTWCGLVADGAVVPLDATDAPERWSRLEETSPVDVRSDVERLRVAADQVAVTDPDDLEAVSRLVLTPFVLDAHARVIDNIRARCRIDVSDLTVMEVR